MMNKNDVPWNSAASGNTDNKGNLLKNALFSSMECWRVIGEKELVFRLGTEAGPHGIPGRAARMRSFDVRNMEKGMCQYTKGLLPGTYLFSADVLPDTNIVGVMQRPGVYLQVTDRSGRVLCESRRLQVRQDKYVHLTCSFLIEQAKSVCVRILLDGIGTVYIRGPKLKRSTAVKASHLLTRDTERWYVFRGEKTYQTGYNDTLPLLLEGREAETCALQIVDGSLLTDAQAGYTLSGRVKIFEKVQNGEHSAQICARICYEDGTATSHTAHVFQNTGMWQCVTVRFATIPSKKVRRMEILCIAGRRCRVCFDDIRLIRE